MAARMPANYASIFKIFSEIKFQLPEYEPKTFFDFGSGVGSAVWAAQAVWNESLSEYFCVDSSSYMNDVAETLLTDEKSGDKYVKNIFFRQFLPASEDVVNNLPHEICPNYSPGHIVIPCPHETPCPLVQLGHNNTCGFSVSYEYIFPRQRQHIKKDWISYVVLRKGPKPKGK
ncbi:methyltransferase-like protein 17, mitochondrial [Trichonephila inaurata madagascariensis]|uniref:Methyltransferase-like protein 17, mitochondrial n=1 Tax=Trichonephila inaurata madagascariensis TaxID=2747483 RepID=A0A8X7BQM3_9ARAC|nr:methyltransferase-like protein 17, mitochondrial [Trichonephila inaurata madagascariensis]